MKELIIVGGPNGAGKSTFVNGYLAEHPMLYLGADAIAAELDPEDPESVAVAAGEEFLHRVDAAIADGISVVVESTLSGRTFRRVIESAKDAGFEVTIFFLWLDSADASLARVKERVAKGGHNVPEADVRRRFLRSLSNFWNLYRPLSDQWNLMYNASHQSQTVAVGTSSSSSLLNVELFGLFLQLIEPPIQ